MTVLPRVSFVALALTVCGAAQAATYASPAAAVDALVAAARSDDPRAVEDVLGPRSGAVVRSGDPVADRSDRAAFTKIFDEKHRIEQYGDTATLIVGGDDRAFPIALHELGGRWLFDLNAARSDILNRRIGRDELSAIQTCRAIADAEREYAQSDHGWGFAEFAQKFMSDPGTRNGLYWPAEAGAPASPLGPLVATARAQGYDGRHAPYHGYYYKILMGQGPHAPGGALDYVVRGHMIGGFAVLAYPAKWGDSGVMTFLVDRDGVVLQRNLGRDTGRLAPAITRYDPDAGWTSAEPAAAK